MRVIAVMTGQDESFSIYGKDRESFVKITGEIVNGAFSVRLEVPDNFFPEVDYENAEIKII